MKRTEEQKYEYYMGHRDYLKQIKILNEGSRETSLFIFIALIYAFGLKMDVVSALCIFLLMIEFFHSIFLIYKTSKQIRKWDESYKNYSNKKQQGKEQ